MHIAIEGCCHGELDQIYASVKKAEQLKGFTVDLLLICGDFQALRSPHDFASLAVPQKFQQLGTFHKYYNGEKVAPVLTIIIGGNHEASNYMWELYHGGWVAPNIYYLGCAGSVMVNGLRISGASGIYKSGDYWKGHFETVPYDKSTMRSIYHIREYDVKKLLLLPPCANTSSTSTIEHSPSSLPSLNPSHSIFLSHDWPLSITPHGDIPTLLKRKPFFAQEIKEDSLGSPPLKDLLKKLRVGWWFSAHLHVKFSALWKHDKLEGEDDEEIVTKFLALDKCVPGKDYLQIVDITTATTPHPSPPIMTFDPHWLAITKATHNFMSLAARPIQLPPPDKLQEFVAKQLEWVIEKGLTDVKVEDVQKFVKTAPGFGEPGGGPGAWYTNPQTEAFCSMLDIKNKINPVPEGFPPPSFAAPGPPPLINEDEIMLDEDEEVNPHHHPTTANPDEIMLSDDEDNTNQPQFLTDKLGDDSALLEDDEDALEAKKIEEMFATTPTSVAATKTNDDEINLDED